MADKVQTKFMLGTTNDGNGFPENYVNNIFVDINPTVDTNGDVDLNDLTTGKIYKEGYVNVDLLKKSFGVDN